MYVCVAIPFVLNVWLVNLPARATQEEGRARSLSLRGRFFARRSSVSTIGGGGDTTIPSPGRSSKQPLPGVGLYNPLHCRQDSLDFSSFHQGVGQTSHGKGYFRAVSSQNGDKYVTPPPPPIVEVLDHQVGFCARTIQVALRVVNKFN